MRIGLTYTGSPEKDQNYVRWIQNGEPDIEVIRLAAEDSNVSAVNSCDGIVLSGGIDIHPDLYGGELSYVKAPEQFRRDRDEFEKAVLERAWELGLPVFGVCRGLQLINVVRGGTLIQDLGEEDETHQNDGATDKVHHVAVFDNTVLRRITGEAGEINSAHHQGIGKLGKDLRVNCHAADGTIEGIEWEDVEGKPFMLAVQWHPERMYKNNYADRAFYASLRDEFIQAIKKGN